MKKSKAFKIAFFITIIHFVIGNLVAKSTVSTLIEVIFMPYTFIAGMSDFAGWDTLSYILEFVSLIVVFTVVYFIVKFPLFGMFRRASRTIDKEDLQSDKIKK